MSEKYDVVVVGGASAGYAAAVAASHAGAERVLVIEKAPRDEVGGNCRFSKMGFRVVHDGTDDLFELLNSDQQEELKGRFKVRPYTKEDFASDLNRVTKGLMDPELARTLVEDSRDAIDWMTELGHKWLAWQTPVDRDGILEFPPGTVLGPVGGGLGLVEQWIKIGDELGIELRTGTRVSGILGDSNRVHGVVVDGPDGRTEIEAKAVILASGGFQASAERRARYLPPGSDLMKVRGSRHNTGEVLDMAVQLGADTSGQWQGGHASPIDASAPNVEVDNKVNRYAYPYGISVNTNGERFFDESERHRTYTYAKTGWAVSRQPDGIAYQIYDQQATALFPDAYRSATPYQADSIAELAEKIGIDPVALERTVSEYNDSVNVAVTYDPTVEDGRNAQGLVPPHSNWALPIEKGPFLAYAVTGAITFSFGGVKTNADGQVLNTSQKPIKGLYANGDIVGMFYHNYPSTSGMTRNVVFGGRAGAHAATEAGR
ncbi:MULTISPECIES: FAD-dependent tricarballylate dehydrogenase TcuA [unclassified Microbacterium]|uniref:FAD-dependent tricarballylate dehydrogenase TcuA n=1 Tax=unclassified Microbacterium TaxID=2609290 RepID=UPI00214B41C5|nr:MULTISPECIES: FAD-dependent tricarballylate dehydrogenase TcuA [unclassified Microbacterium]MCR2800398.1 FAD-dependent tricarballylate dehydrogenase TcuA [Microbacterium sp. zg.Y818]MCR2826224.1 FAD-dependent tricarballylate dehydrogenase TcuA [Microbacterium sp. zg.Y909]MCR2826650.1 FAD-dependent tricarballylate dehydrogenase TcuA [Microbacterium sp. zg.Y909]WIM22358.1 FAD-dependent tricarballylate dehydrogenase TcuA [Microbacterium sp. zg-Y818]